MTLKFLEGLGLVENKRNLFAGEVFDSEQVFQALQHFFPLVTVGSGLREDCQVSGNAVNEHDAFIAINFLQVNFHDFSVAGLDRVADERGFDGHFAMAAVNQHAEADALGAAQIEETVHGGANGAAGVEHVVHDHQIAIIHAEADFVRVHDRLRSYGRKIVAIQSDVNRADGDFHAGEIFDGFREAFGERNAAAADPDQCEVIGAASFFYDAHLAHHPSIDGGKFAWEESR